MIGMNLFDGRVKTTPFQTAEAERRAEDTARAIESSGVDPDALYNFLLIAPESPRPSDIGPHRNGWRATRRG